MTLLELSEVTYAYPVSAYRKAMRKQSSVYAAHNISLRLDAGTCLGLLGTSGAGKSTIARIILGLQPPQSGTVRIDGIDLYQSGTADRKALRRRVQAVFQDSYSSVNPRMTVAQIIAEPLENFEKLQGQKLSSRVTELLELVKLDTQIAQHFPHQCSGGQLQRVGIARAIASHPSLIVLDEAVSSLDLANQAEMIRLLLELNKQLKMSYVFITHNLKAAALLGDHWAFLEKGSMCATFDSLAEMRASSHPTVQQLWSASLSGNPRKSLLRPDRLSERSSISEKDWIQP